MLNYVLECMPMTRASFNVNDCRRLFVILVSVDGNKTTSEQTHIACKKKKNGLPCT